ncbi:tripartite tricarboxylate transporter substrate binding protein [Allopusillimonas soli]|uniref:Tripartite tricarboxylate transporter substrate binding protein n=1 Tax=Allopusillimonas soli TaxID=659016 RepID=A0A853FHI6_9BURK|nr:tripartite tricarboxylate transporter substrate binding protein [Allopusillimonas soli]NYT37446.1 tripartite tricarboxylate transporter substrate binding protein [Allopusillimonas soli]TEA74573.1 tripartite tricarboxylate transporter substrate binding protein [Allopusillimonas soli]
MAHHARIARIGRALVLAGSLFSATAFAFPDQPIRLLIPYPPGGSADALARPLTPILEKELGQSVVVDYRPGGGGVIATSELARAKPDGHTILMVLAAHAINPSLRSSLPYDTEKDFAGVSLLATLPLIVAAPKSTPADDIPSLIKYAKAHPGELTFASAGPGNTSHLAGELFKVSTGTDLLHVPYKGSGPAVIALLGGEVSLMFDSISTSLPQVRAGKLKALAVTGKERSGLLPDLPTVGETVDGFEVSGWYGILAPAGTPPEAIQKLNKAFVAAVKNPKARAQLENIGYSIDGSTPEAFDAHIKREIKRWADIIESSGTPKIN